MDIDKMADELLNSVVSGSKTEKKPVNTYSLPGKGRKFCNNCQKYVGAKTKECVCGYVFVKSEHAATASTTDMNSKYDEPVTDEDRRYALAAGLSHGCTTIYAGVGSCPASLCGYDYDSVKQFCEDIVSVGVPQRKLYMPSAIKHWLAGIINDEIAPMYKLAEFVNQWYDEKIASTMGLEV